MSIASIHEEPAAVTKHLAERTANLNFEDLDADTLAVAKQCLIDWFAVTLAGAGERVGAGREVESTLA